MIVKITNFDENAEMPYIDYEVRGLLQIQMDFLNENLEEETSIDEDIFNIRLYFEDFFPFQSEVAKIRLDDFIAREEIEMNVFLSSFLEDM
ncbi:MAG: hypothetical protein IJP99_05595 [Methanobrevibacter sp.]|uniref:Uncharacterized protein n=1 Tax=Methanobrevibacter millerae TaxID=230361 RepID=A0A8T3VJF8_9EURY|nr:DUF5750 family protein [Methanobrevibacter millerae]MBE6504891.1 hypothetical protein [Methanobrevibacter millerae]MBR0058790.1 hypothetical protein [Methanobrevibacter sp.]